MYSATCLRHTSFASAYFIWRSRTSRFATAEHIIEKVLFCEQKRTFSGGVGRSCKEHGDGIAIAKPFRFQSRHVISIARPMEQAEQPHEREQKKRSVFRFLFFCARLNSAAKWWSRAELNRRLTRFKPAFYILISSLIPFGAFRRTNPRRRELQNAIGSPQLKPAERPPPENDARTQADGKPAPNSR